MRQPIKTVKWIFGASFTQLRLGVNEISAAGDGQTYPGTADGADVLRLGQPGPLDSVIDSTKLNRFTNAL